MDTKEYDAMVREKALELEKKIERRKIWKAIKTRQKRGLITIILVYFITFPIVRNVAPLPNNGLLWVYFISAIVCVVIGFIIPPFEIEKSH